MDNLRDALAKKILIFDGAMGTMIQNHNPEESEFRGTRFADGEKDLRGNNDLLSLTQPDLIRQIHAEYLEAGADIIATNTFSSTQIAQADYGMESIVQELNRDAAELAVSVAEEYSS